MGLMGVEEAMFSVDEKIEPIEIRNYEPHILVEVEVKKIKKHRSNFQH
jgi:hypothetical protein